MRPVACATATGIPLARSPSKRTDNHADQGQYRDDDRNTTETVRENPLLGLMLGTPDGIVASERRGQQELVASEQLPIKCGDMGEAAYLALGFTLGAPTSGDTLFRAATLPAGWKRDGSDHAMYSYIVDKRGFRRVTIFYKAAFYDRAAHMYLNRVGGDMAQTALYGDETPTAESLRLNDLTAEERQEFVDGLAGMDKNIKDCPSVYGKYATRLSLAQALAVST